MRNVFYHWALLLALPLIAISCIFLPEPFSSPPSDELVFVRVNSVSARMLTKASLLAGVESRSSGAIVAAYDADTGLLECVIDADGHSGMNLHAGHRYDFYALGNLNYIHRNSGEAHNLREALGDAFPCSEAALEAFVYRLDGGSVSSSPWRREDSADVASLGIPYSSVLRSLTPEAIAAAGGLSFTDCRHLFAKVSLIVDHGAMDRGEESARDWFRNVSLCVRQAHCRLLPFSCSEVRAESSQDILGAPTDDITACFDYDGSMLDGTNVEYTLYVPENAQGLLLPGNDDPSGKTPYGLLAAGRESRSELCTFVELAGEVSSSAGGYGGAVYYRFFLGSDPCRDFSVLGGYEYRVTLSLRPETVFGGEWKVSSTLDDRRILRLFSDSARTAELSVTQPLAVSIGDGSRVFVSCDDGQGNDIFLRSTFSGAGWTPSGLDDVGLGASFWTPSDDDTKWFASCGLSASWQPLSRSLLFRVEDVTAFAAHRGERRELKVHILPGDASCTRSFFIELSDCTSETAGDFRYEILPTYSGNNSYLTFTKTGSNESMLTEASVHVDGNNMGSCFVFDGTSFSLGKLSEGGHTVELDIRFGSETYRVHLLSEIVPVPKVSVSFGLRSLLLTCWKNVRNADGRPYVAARRSSGRIWVEFTPNGRYDDVNYSFSGAAGMVNSQNRNTFDITPTAFGEYAFRVTFSLGRSVHVVTVPYIVYESVVFRAVEEHGALVLLSNNVSVGWETLDNSTLSTTYASVRWQLALTLLCSDNTRVSGHWGPFTDSSASVGDGSRHLRSFHDEFKSLRQSFENGHRLQDADRLEGTMSFRVTFSSPFLLADVTGTTFADFSGVVSAESETPSAHELLRHWGEHQSRFYGYRNR